MRKFLNLLESGIGLLVSGRIGRNSPPNINRNVTGCTFRRGGYTRKVLGEVEFIFASAPQHPLAQAAEPHANSLIRQYRAVVAADSSRQRAPKTIGLLSGQAVLTVPDLNIKHLAQKQCLGVCYLPRHLITKDLQAGHLIEKATEDGESIHHTLYYLWRTEHQGKALAWFKEQLCGKDKKLDWFTS